MFGLLVSLKLVYMNMEILGMDFELLTLVRTCKRCFPTSSKPYFAISILNAPYILKCKKYVDSNIGMGNGFNKKSTSHQFIEKLN